MHFTNNPLFSFFSEAVENAKENISEEDPKSTNQSVDINTKTEAQPGTKSNDCAKSPQGSETCVLHLNTLETRFWGSGSQGLTFWPRLFKSWIVLNWSTG